MKLTNETFSFTKACLWILLFKCTGPQANNFFDILYREDKSQIAIIGLANVDILLAVLLTRRWQMSCCSMSLVQQALHIYANVMPTIIFQVSRWANVGYFNCWNSSVEPMSGKCQYANHYPTLAQRLLAIWDIITYILIENLRPVTGLNTLNRSSSSGPKRALPRMYGFIDIVIW